MHADNRIYVWNVRRRTTKRTVKQDEIYGEERKKEGLRQ